MKNDTTSRCPQCGLSVGAPLTGAYKVHEGNLWHPACLAAAQRTVNYDRASTPDGV